jgi:hypothetical protein
MSSPLNVLERFLQRPWNPGWKIFLQSFFDQHDGTHNDFPIIVNQNFAWRFFSHEDPIGKRVRVGAPDWPWRTIVGVVGDIKQLAVSRPSEAEMYRPYTAPSGDPLVSHENSFATTIVIRSRKIL